MCADPPACYQLSKSTDASFHRVNGRWMDDELWERWCRMLNVDASAADQATAVITL